MMKKYLKLLFIIIFFLAVVRRTGSQVTRKERKISEWNPVSFHRMLPRNFPPKALP